MRWLLAGVRPAVQPRRATAGRRELNPHEQTGRIASRACEEFSAYLRALAAERRARPKDDLITALTQVLDHGDRLTEDELVGTCVLVLNAGHEATVNVTGKGWWSLLRNPAALRPCGPARQVCRKRSRS